jgi:hypothetical protein
MRWFLGILFILFFVGSAGCIILLGGPPSQVYALKDVILAGTFVCVALSAIVLGMLVLGVGAKGKRMSSWRVPLLCVAALLVSLIFGVLILTVNPSNLTEQHVAMTLRMRISALALIVFALFSLGSLIASIIWRKRHNSKLALQGDVL